MAAFVAVLVLIPALSYADSNTDLLAGINAYRATRYLPPVYETDTTCSVATLRAIQIMDDFSHTGFSAVVHSSWAPQGMWYENLALQYDAGFDVLRAWENSPTHNANLLANITNGCIRHIGYYWTFEAWHE